MMEPKITVRPATERRPVHPSITAEQISVLVETFYTRVQQDAQLAPIFEKHITGEWGPHLEKMKGFWRSVLLRTAEYNGRPVPVHVRMGRLEKDDFRTWLGLFRETVDEVFEPGARRHVVEAAERIASSLWLATNGDLLARPPEWSEN